MKKAIIFACSIFAIAQLSVANTDKLYSSTPDHSVKFLKTTLLSNAYNNHLHYLKVKAFREIDSANSRDPRLSNHAYLFLDYLPLTAGSSYPLTGTLVGTDASFTANGNVINLNAATSPSANAFSFAVRTILDGDFSITDRANSASRLYISPSGSIGIGTTSPGYKLDVAGTAKFIGNGDVVSLNAVTNPSDNRFSFALRTVVDGDFSLVDKANSATRLYIHPSGNIGIGTTAPGKKLDVVGVGNFTSNGEALSLESVTSPSLNGFGLAVRTVLDGDFSLVDNTNTATRLYVAPAGNIGVGTTTPCEKLSVDGNISANGFMKAKKVIVTESVWCDYVFDKKYKLKSLSSLESFIKQNKHLPEVPSAKEVEEKGISVGDNQALLLKKIEELTLYMIEMNKNNLKMRKEIYRQSKEIEKLKNSNKRERS